MRSTKKILIAMSFIICGSAQADMHLKCADGVQLEACADKVEKTLAKMGCEIQKEETECFFGLVDDPNSDKPDVNIPTDTPLCSVRTSNCSHAPDMLFSFGESCRESELKMKIPKSSKVTNNYWKGIWAPYSRVVCKSKK